MQRQLGRGRTPAAASSAAELALKVSSKGGVFHPSSRAAGCKAHTVTSHAECNNRHPSQHIATATRTPLLLGTARYRAGLYPTKDTADRHNGWLTGSSSWQPAHPDGHKHTLFFWRGQCRSGPKSLAAVPVQNWPEAHQTAVIGLQCKAVTGSVPGCRAPAAAGLGHLQPTVPLTCGSWCIAGVAPQASSCALKLSTIWTQSARRAGSALTD